MKPITIRSISRETLAFRHRHDDAYEMNETRVDRAVVALDRAPLVLACTVPRQQRCHRTPGPVPPAPLASIINTMRQMLASQAITRTCSCSSSELESISSCGSRDVVNLRVRDGGIDAANRPNSRSATRFVRALLPVCAIGREHQSVRDGRLIASSSLPHPCPITDLDALEEFDHDSIAESWQEGLDRQMQGFLGSGPQIEGNSASHLQQTAHHNDDQLLKLFVVAVGGSCQ